MLILVVYYYWTVRLTKFLSFYIFKRIYSKPRWHCIYFCAIAISQWYHFENEINSINSIENREEERKILCISFYRNHIFILQFIKFYDFIVFKSWNSMLLWGDLVSSIFNLNPIEISWMNFTHHDNSMWCLKKKKINSNFVMELHSTTYICWHGAHMAR